MLYLRSYCTMINIRTCEVIRGGFIMVTRQVFTMIGVVQSSCCDVRFLIPGRMRTVMLTAMVKIQMAQSSCVIIWLYQDIHVLLRMACPTAVTMLDISSVVRGHGNDSKLLQSMIFHHFMAAVVAALSALLHF